MMQITGTHINYYLLCHRKLWLFAHSIQMEHTSDLVYEGKQVHETTYTRRSEKFEEVELAGIKVDFFDAKNKVIHEVKKTAKMEEAHLWQLKYYLYVFENHGVEGVSGILEYPKQRKTEEVWLSIPDRERIKEMLAEVQQVIARENCPPVINKPRCKSCAYFDFCYVNEKAEV